MSKVIVKADDFSARRQMNEAPDMHIVVHEGVSECSQQRRKFICEDYTIAAIATPLGQGGVGVVRVSGPKSRHIAENIVRSVPEPRKAEYRAFYHDNQILDRGLVLFFPAPHSFTGEDVLELQGHGGSIILQMLLEAVVAQGATLAAPGEFTQRAFLNGKLDLAQAEAVADLIHAATKEAALSATRSLQGVFSEKINAFSENILHLRMMVEAAIDFPEEEIEMLSETSLTEKINKLSEALQDLFMQSRQGQLLKEGISLAIVGQPNAGKSSLLNYLTQENTAIVTSIPGTTRDIVKATIQIDGIPIHLMDTAGIREKADEIEKIGIAKSKEQQQLADYILLVMDVSQNELTIVEKEIIDRFKEKIILVKNKIDLLPRTPCQKEEIYYISAKTGEGISALLDHLKVRIKGVSKESSVFLSRQRHLLSLQRTLDHIAQAKQQLVQHRAFELAAQELSYAQDALGEIVGKVSSDALLGEIFSQFCIGK